MRDLLSMVIIERQTILRGLTVSFLLILPFTFLPTIIHYGWILKPIIQRLPYSTLYAFGFSFIVVAASIFHNYNNLVDRKKIFDKPAFKKLDFYGRVDGFGSQVTEIETFLFGKINKYYYRVSIVDPGIKKFKVVIIPWIDYTDNEKLKNILVKEHNFKKGVFASLHLKLTDKDLDNETLLWDKLTYLDELLAELGAKQILVNESNFDD